MLPIVPLLLEFLFFVFAWVLIIFFFLLTLLTLVVA